MEMVRKHEKIVIWAIKGAETLKGAKLLPFRWPSRKHGGRSLSVPRTLWRQHCWHPAQASGLRRPSSTAWGKFDQCWQLTWGWQLPWRSQDVIFPGWLLEGLCVQSGTCRWPPIWTRNTPGQHQRNCRLGLRPRNCCRQNDWLRQSSAPLIALFFPYSHFLIRTKFPLYSHFIFLLNRTYFDP